MRNEYNPAIIEKNIQDKWDTEKRYQAQIDKEKNFTVYPCSLIRQASYIWVMLETTQLGT